MESSSDFRPDWEPLWAKPEVVSHRIVVIVVIVVGGSASGLALARIAPDLVDTTDDLIQVNMDLTRMLELPDELVYIWHTHRTEVLISAGVLFACVRLAIHWRTSRSKQILTPLLGTPINEKPFVNSDVAEVDHFSISPPTTSARPKAGPKRVTGVKRTKSSNPDVTKLSEVEKIQPIIFYFSLGGSTKTHAEQLQQSFQCDSSTNTLPPILHDLTEIDYDDFFVASPRDLPLNTAAFYLVLLPSYEISTELDNFLDHLKETHHDFRIDTAPLSGLAGYSIFGFGDKLGWPTESDGFCTQAVEVDKWMAKLTGGRRGFPVGCADTNAAEVQMRLDEWRIGVEAVVKDVAAGNGLGDGVSGSGDAIESGDEDDLDQADPDVTKSRRKAIERSITSDLEDLKAPVPIPVDFTTTSATTTTRDSRPKAMVPLSSPTYTSLTKQGYTIVGTHSGVKLCRWTKSALRGRGSCYKYSFYGIASHLCMEATPSLSCSNKCVFCWRHGTNPVSTTWKWTVDPPELVFAGMKEGHYKKIKVMRGVPGVKSERFQEAMQIRHCALSLVGEPIFYPHINELLAMLHKERISSFLVCNAQHPDQLAALGPVTQLYVSIDASNKDSLKRIDRPLHRDFWERFLRCMDILKEKRFTHRTVFRLTLVKGFNVEEEAEGYASLVERALPAFVEVKGVTYCGTSTAAGAGLSMSNVPFYEEVKEFVLALESAMARRGLEYGIAAEHAHSCCILLADKKRFYRTSASDGTERWHTLIDYGKFFERLKSGNAFGPEDYIGEPTPEWALWGNGGFDPRDERVDRKGRAKVVDVE